MMVFSSNLFTWKKGHAHATVQDLGLNNHPKDGFSIKSARTGQVKHFVYDSKTMIENEFFDGEGCAYRAQYGSETAQIWF